MEWLKGEQITAATMHLFVSFINALI
nr:hypothetical protein [Ningiella sp. W23]